ncbi:MAG: tetratricopeptide repeat protein [Mucilaginibacter sp.]
MKYFILLILLPFFSLAQSNDQLIQGHWVKVKAQKKDGSRIIDHNGCGMDFLKYNFGMDGMADMSSDVFFDGFKLPYRLGHDTLVVGGNLYNVIGLNKDTLKLSFFAPGVDDNQLPVYYFAKAQDYHSQAAATYNAALKDSVYQATNGFFPQCKGRLLTLMEAIATNYDKGTLKASFIVDKKGRVKGYTILGIDSISKGFAKTVGNAFGDLQWIPAHKNNLPVNSLVQVTVKTGRSAFGSSTNIMNTLKVQYDFLPKAPYDEIDRDEFETSQQYFKEAINQSNNNNYQKALELVNKCIDIDKINIGAYYMRAMINTALNKPQEACKDWATLAAFGQVEATKKMAKYCKN